MTVTDSSDRDLVARVRQLCRPLRPIDTGAATRLPHVADIRAVLFDVYGTLLISASGDIGADSGREEIKAFAETCDGVPGVPGVSVSASARERAPAMVKQVILERHAELRSRGVDYPEVNIVDIWRDALGRLDTNLTEPVLRRMALEYECRVNPVWPMPGAARLLADLRRRGLRLGIVSNAQFYTPLALHALLGKPLPDLGFTPDYCVWSYREREAKPSTALYKKALTTLEVQDRIAPEQVLYVGNDRRNDIWPAAALGCRTALFAGDRRSLRLRADDPRLVRVRPDAVVTALAQLDGLLPNG